MAHHHNINDLLEAHLHPIHLAAKQKDGVDTVHQILDAPGGGDELNARAVYIRWTPLMFACNEGNDAVVEALVDRGADINYRPNSTQLTPLLCAVRNNHLRCVQILLTGRRDGTRADPNQGKRNGFRPLHEAASRGHVDIIKELLEDKRTEVNAQNRQGRTALFMAAKTGHPEAVDLLVKMGGADFSIKDKTKNKAGITPRQIAEVALAKARSPNQEEGQGAVLVDDANIARLQKCITILRVGGQCLGGWVSRPVRFDLSVDMVSRMLSSLWGALCGVAAQRMEAGEDRRRLVARAYRIRSDVYNVEHSLRLETAMRGLAVADMPTRVAVAGKVPPHLKHRVIKNLPLPTLSLDKRRGRTAGDAGKKRSRVSLERGEVLDELTDTLEYVMDMVGDIFDNEFLGHLDFMRKMPKMLAATA